MRDPEQARAVLAIAAEIHEMLRKLERDVEDWRSYALECEEFIQRKEEELETPERPWRIKEK